MYKLLLNRENMYLYPWYIADEVLTKDMKKKFGIGISKTILEFKKNHLYYYGILDEYNNLGAFFWKRIKKNHNFYIMVEKNIKKYSQDLENFLCQFKKYNLKKLSNRRLFNLYIEYIKHIKNLRLWGWIMPLVDGMGESFLSDYLNLKFNIFLTKIKKEKYKAKYFTILSSSSEKSFVKLEELERLKLLILFRNKDLSLINFLKTNNYKMFWKTILKYKDIKSKIGEHLKKFKYLTYAYSGPGLNKRQLFDLMRDSLDSSLSIDQQIKNIKNYSRSIEKRKKDLINKINLNQELIYLFKVYSSFMYLKDFRKGEYQKSYVIIDSLIKEMSIRSSLSLIDFKYLSKAEIKDLIVNGKKCAAFLSKRKIYSMFLIQNAKVHVLNSTEIKKIKKMIKKDSFVFNGYIKGMTSFNGCVRGLVKIISTDKDLKKMNNGDILVSSTTNPSLINAMKKSAAIVTDIGGITSHAAIVSRELKKPCIIGTKIATKVLKDGDLVEVDANQGIIKLLNNHN